MLNTHTGSRNMMSLLGTVRELKLTFKGFWLERNFVNPSEFLFLCLVGMVVNQPVSLCSIYMVYCKCMCTCEDPAFIASMSPLWSAGYSLVLITLFISPWLELKLQLHFVIFSAHPCAMPQFLLGRTPTCFSFLRAV